MNVRSLALVLSLSLPVSACSMPRTALTAGALITAGGVAEALAGSRECAEDCGFGDLAFGGASMFLGLTTAAIGSVLILSGVVGLAQEPAEPPQEKLLRVTETPAALEAASAGTARDLNPEFDDHALASRQLALRVRVAARAGRCAAANLMAQRLHVVDPDVASLLQADVFVARCADSAGALGATALSGPNGQR